MDQDKRAKTEERIRLMIKKAESTTPAEAEMIMEQVERLMLKLGLDDITALVADNDLSAFKVAEVTFTFEGVYARAYAFLASDIGQSIGSTYALSRDIYDNGRKVGLALTVYGIKRDIERVEILVNSLVLQCITALTEYIKVNGNTGTASQKYNTKRSFIMGFGRGAADRIARNRHDITSNAEPGTALVVADVRSRVVADVQERFKIRAARRVKITTNGFLDGVTAGSNARTGETSIGQRKSIAG